VVEALSRPGPMLMPVEFRIYTDAVAVREGKIGVVRAFLKAGGRRE